MRGESTKMTSYEIITGNSIDLLQGMTPESVDCVVTSPPYWLLRDYGVAGQIGLEASINEYIDNIAMVFSSIKNILKPTGNLFLNIGDCYSQTKNLIGMPWRIAFALQDAGWILRQDIIWHKPNPMPESVLDRCTRAHEYIFHFVKSQKYYWDKDAIATENMNPGDDIRRFRKYSIPTGWEVGKGSHGHFHSKGRRPKQDELGKNTYTGFNARYLPNEKANRRSVWSIPTQAFPEAHFATFPREIPKLCILAGCPVGGTVLDPFCGSGTTGIETIRLGCQFIGIELNPEYADMSRKRIQAVINQGGDMPLFKE
jgi:DNA modification methylase